MAGLDVEGNICRTTSRWPRLVASSVGAVGTSLELSVVLDGQGVEDTRDAGATEEGAGESTGDGAIGWRTLS